MKGAFLILSLSLAVQGCHQPSIPSDQRRPSPVSTPSASPAATAAPTATPKPVPSMTSTPIPTATPAFPTGLHPPSANEESAIRSLPSDPPIQPNELALERMEAERRKKESGRDPAASIPSSTP